MWTRACLDFYEVYYRFSFVTDILWVSKRWQVRVISNPSPKPMLLE